MHTKWTLPSSPNPSLLPPLRRCKSFWAPFANPSFSEAHLHAATMDDPSPESPTRLAPPFANRESASSLFLRHRSGGARASWLVPAPSVASTWAWTLTLGSLLPSNRSISSLLFPLFFYSLRVRWNCWSFCFSYVAFYRFWSRLVLLSRRIHRQAILVLLTTLLIYGSDCHVFWILYFELHGHESTFVLVNSLCEISDDYASVPNFLSYE